ncbi:Hypothetical predicted protein [Marmota monax]|uniref:Uncharacterized protein n=1 Tax=Marmota monax TaxID=9995 RepID=A0A5E4A6D8_MARMO|nr:Hypothetical predicted protein [Marmota monax]
MSMELGRKSLQKGSFEKAIVGKAGGRSDLSEIVAGQTGCTSLGRTRVSSGSRTIFEGLPGFLLFQLLSEYG